MGGAVSAGENNDELIDNLVEAEYIKTPAVEKIFRAVDRGDYYIEGCRESAYRDLAWKHGKVHMSAPCIYSEVMESLHLGQGMSFLNLGSGTGYLSTMAGLMLGTYGINHGVELHREVVDYAYHRLEDFQNTSPAIDKYEFCPPSFVVGNCLLLDCAGHQYDRVYCGAACPTEHENYIKNLVRIGGILVMPLNDHLLQIKRTGQTTYEVKSVLPVSFASLILPDPDNGLIPVKLPEMHPLSLQEICRSSIRVLLRRNVEIENPSLLEMAKRMNKPTHKKAKKHIKRIVVQERNLLREMEGDPSVDNGSDHEDEPDPEDSILRERAAELFGSRSKIVLDFTLRPIRQVTECLEHSCRGNSEEVYAGSQLCDLEVELEHPPKREKKISLNGDSGIDNVSDDSFPEEYPSDSEKPASNPTNQDMAEERPSSPFEMLDDVEDIEADDEENEPQMRTNDRDAQEYRQSRSSEVIFKRVAVSDIESDGGLDEMDDTDSGTDYFTIKQEDKNLFTYTYFLSEKINQLPLPHALKVFLKFSRPD